MAATPVPIFTGTATDLVATGTQMFSALGFSVIVLTVLGLSLAGKILRLGKKAAR